MLESKGMNAGVYSLVGLHLVVRKEELRKQDRGADCSINWFTCDIIILVNLLLLNVTEYKSWYVVERLYPNCSKLFSSSCPLFFHINFNAIKYTT